MTDKTPEQIRKDKARLAFRERNKKAGLCRDCIQPRLPDARFCAKHLEKQRAWSRDRQRRVTAEAKAYRAQQEACTPATRTPKEEQT